METYVTPNFVPFKINIKTFNTLEIVLSSLLLKIEMASFSIAKKDGRKKWSFY